MLKITIITREQRSFKLDCSLNSFIKNLKFKIQKKEGIPTSQQRIIYKCKILNDNTMLKDYSLESNSKIYLVNKNESLLLKSSKIFDNSNIIDRIRQSYIDLRQNPPEEEVDFLLKEAYSFIDECCDSKILKEVINLIIECFNNYTDLSHKFFKEFLLRENISSNYIILNLELFSYLHQYFPDISLNNYKDFIQNSYKEILPQIQNGKNVIWYLFKHIIPSEFIFDLIIDIALLSEITEELVINFSPYFMNYIHFSKIDFFIEKVSEAGLLKLIPVSSFLKDDFYINLSHENLSSLISIVSKQTFLKILPNLEENLVRKNDLTSPLSFSIISKCIEYNIKIKYINDLLDQLEDFELPLNFVNYFIENQIELNEKVTSQIKIFPKSPLIFEVISNPEIVPEDILSFVLETTDNIHNYGKILNSEKIKSPVLTTLKFWKHIMSLLTKENDVIDNELFHHLSIHFKNNIKKSQFIEFFNHLIFDDFAPSSNQSHLLVSILNAMDEDCKAEFFSKENNDLRVKKLLSTKSVPFISICHFFDVTEYLNRGPLSPLLLYVYSAIAFKDKSKTLEIKTVEIIPHQKNCDDKILIEFIKKNNDYEVIKNIDEESLSLIISAIIFAFENVEVVGLTKENILPFYAISLTQLFGDEKSLNHSTNRMLELLIESIDLIEKNPTPLLNASLNQILLKAGHFLDSKYFPIKTSFEFIDKLMNLYLNNKYKENKSYFIYCIFNMSLSSDQFKPLFDKYGISILEFILNNKSEFIDKKYNDFDLDVFFDKNEVKKVLFEAIQNSTSDKDTYQTIIFIINFCKNRPELNFTDFTKINKACEKVIDESKWEALFLIYDFMKTYKIEFDFNILKGKTIPIDIIRNMHKTMSIVDIDVLTDFLMNDTNPYDTYGANDLMLYHSLISNSSYLRFKYIMGYLDRNTISQRIFFQSFLSNGFLIINEYLHHFFNILDHYYAYCKEENAFIKKIDVEPLPLSSVRPDCSFIIKLLKNHNIGSYSCLHKLSCYFPFLFDEWFDLIIENVLPIFDSINQFFDCQDEEKINELKTCYCALSFLLNCSYSTKFISLLVDYIFNNIMKLNEKQVYCFSLLLLSFFQTNKLFDIILAIAYKNKFIDIVMNLISKCQIDNNENEFKNAYISLLMNISKFYYLYISRISTFSYHAYMEAIKNRLIQNPFEIAFDYCSLIPCEKIDPIKIEFSHQNHFTEIFYDFCDKVNMNYPFMITYQSIQLYQVDRNTESLFEDSLNKKYDFVRGGFQKEEINITVRMLLHLYLQPNWAFNYIFYGNDFPLLPDQYNYLKKIIDKLHKLEPKQNTKKKLEDSLCPYEIDPYECYANEIYNEKFFKFLMKVVEESCNGDNHVYDLISVISEDDKNMISYLHYISEYLLNIEDQLSLYSTSILLTKLSYLIRSIVDCNENMKEYFYVICGNKFIDISLSAFLHDFVENLENAILVSICVDNDIPYRVYQIIGLIFNLYPEQIPLALNLYHKVEKKKQSYIFPMIENEFEKEKQKEELDLELIQSFLANVPILAFENLEFIDDILIKCLNDVKDSNFDDNVLIELICTLLIYIAPDRSESPSLTTEKISKMDENKDSLLLLSASDALIKSSPHFWNDIYEKYRPILSEMIAKNELIFDELFFLHYFYELVPFQIRYSNFKRNMKKLIKPFDVLKISIERSNILQDTFDILSNCEPEDLLYPIEVNFKGEKGVDMGGLTKDWFSCIVKEIFNTDFGLFSKSENESYHPSPLSYINSNHVEYFKLAGQIIGLALLHDQNVSAHLSMAFIRQILHQQIILKDLEDYDESLMKSLQSILEMKDVKQLDLVFSINDNQFGKVKSIDLIKNGSKIPVTNSNRNQYVSLYTDYKLKKSVKCQITAFCDAFDSIVPHEYIHIFSPSELNLMICGIPKIDVNDMKEYTHFILPYHKNHPVIVMFFNMLSKWSHENLAKFLLFLTGSSQVAVNGFKDFVDRGKPITISPGGEKNRLPVAHTCSNFLDLPEYDDEDDMNKKLLLAIQNCEFGII